MKKRIVAFLLVITSTLVLVACTSPESKKLKEGANVLTVPAEVVADFEVDAKAGEATVTWVSSNEEVLTVGETAEDKTSIKVTPKLEATNVDLTATLTVGTKTLDKKFVVKVLALPTITGAKDIVIDSNVEPKWLEGVTATDALGKELKVTVDTSKIPVNKAGNYITGQYQITYKATDDNGNSNTAVVAVRIGDVSGPVISGVRVFNVVAGSAKPTWTTGVTAKDDKDATSTVTVDDSAVDLSAVGTYDLVFKSVDAAGNETVLTTVVNVSEETTSALKKVELDQKVSSNLTLPTTVDSVNVNWSSSNTAVISTTGAVTRQEFNTAVKLTATAIKGELQSTREFWVTVFGTDVDLNGVYNASFGEIVTLNPLMSTGNSDSDVYEYLTSTLYSGDYDWEQAIKDGNAAFPGDFSKIKSDRNPNGTVDMPSIAYKRTLLMASEFPYAVNKKTRNVVEGTYGTYLNTKSARETIDNEWIIELRDDLEFADGTKITADTYEYTFKQYLNGKIANERANYLYTDDYVPLVNGKEYYDGVVGWDQVGYEKINDYAFKLYLSSEVTQYEFIGSLSIIYLVHPDSYEKGFLQNGTVNNYGSIQNPLVSYGPYTLSNNYDTTNKFVFTKNEKFVQAWDYSIKTINGPIIKEQKDTINEFKAGNLDVAGVGGEFWDEYQEHKNLYISPSNSFYRIAISLDRSKGNTNKVSAPILAYPEFRKALYLATERNDFANNVQPPSQGALGFLSNIHQVTEWAKQAYASSSIFSQQLTELGLEPEKNGFDSAEAKRLFEEAYTKAVADGKYTQGQKVVVEFLYYDAGSNTRIANWVKAQYESVFGSNFEIKLNAVSSAELTAQRNIGDFDLVFTGMSGATFQATFGMGYIFSPSFSTFLSGKGHDVPNLPVEADISNLFDIIGAKAEDKRTASEKKFYDALKANNGTFKGKFDDLFLLFNNTAELKVEYDGQEEDLTKITAALEKALLEQMIAVPLFSATSAAVYSDRVVRQAHAYHLFLGWGGLSYTYIKASK
ncbi:ABC transporter substrate-binding protein [Haploplasma axanthum]|uniref:Periplasmic oligopeptide-binding protein n=1 Tax=Haploplasma axanthum TaxID=29552 RepID=A0A449BCZ2_HAPAX|nr:ABC transporter substrate-binding protein [Haploplasma axanthum]VEU80323.1 Periplasmic oligopeptide-binding protein precursor [Haploplasma axanthum]